METTAQTVAECRCCGKQHTAEGWKSLPLVGEQNDAVELIELRTCTCRSTVAVARLRPGLVLA